MDQAENMNFPEEKPDDFEKLLNNFTEDTNFNQSQVNQIIISIFSVDHNEILHYQQNFISFLVNPPQISSELLVSSEILTLIAICLSSFQISYLDKPIHDSFIKSWSKFNEYDDINTEDLFKLAIIFNQLTLINDISRKQLCILASILIHFLELDCISNRLPISMISLLLDCLHHFFKKTTNTEMKRRVISACNYYLNATAQPILMLIANKFIIQNHNQYNKCLQYITQSLQNVRSFQEDSLHYAFTSISDYLYLSIKNCSPWSINDAFFIVTSIYSQEPLIEEEQINAMLALNFFGIDKKINNETYFFNFSINSLTNEKVDVPLLQICDSFRFSPIISIRNYQIFTIFFIYSVKIDTFLIQLQNETVSDDQLLNIIESFGRNFEYFKSIITSIMFFNHGLENGFFNTINEFKKPIMNQFNQTMKLFFQLIISFTSTYEYPKDECTEYDDDCDTLLYKFSKECKHITILRKSWEIVNFVTRRIFEFLSIFPDNVLSIIYSNYISLLFNANASKLYVFVMSAFLPCMKKFVYFLISFYVEILKEIENGEFVKNAFIFLKWLNQFLKKNPQRSDLNDHFINSTKFFFIKFFKFTFSTSYSILLHYSLIKELLKLITKLFGEKVLFKIIPADVLIQLYFNVPSCNKENKFLNQLMIQLYTSHKSILSKFEWYRKLLLKHAILRPKITIPAIKENNLIYDYRNTLEFQKFARDLLAIFDSYSSNELRKIVLEMISYIPAKFTTYSVQPIVDVSNYWIYTISLNEKMIVINGRDLVNYIREIITCTKPENQFEDFVNFVNFHSKSENYSQIIQIEKEDKNDGLSEIFSFLGLLAIAAIEKCELVEQFLFVQDIFTLIIRFGRDYKKYLPDKMTPTFLAHFVVSLAINNYSFNDELNEYYSYNEDTPEYFLDFLSEVEKVLYKVSYPFYHHSIFVAKFLIEHFSKSSIDFIQFTRFTVNFILRQLDDRQLFPSHHLITDDEITFNLCHFLPSQIFEIVIFLKENAYNYNALDFLPLFSIKLPFIAMFSLSEIVSKSQLNETDTDKSNDDEEDLFIDVQKKKEVVDFLKEFAEIDITQIVPLLLLFPEHQSKFINLFNESIKSATSKNQPEPVKIPYIFYLLDLPQSTFKNSIEVLKNCFIESNASDSLLIADCLLKANSVISESKRSSSSFLSSFVENILSSNGFSTSLFVANDLSSFEHLFSLFVLKPSIVIESIKTQLKLLNEKKYKNSFLVDSNFKFFVDFLSLPSVLSYLAENKEYKKFGKILLTIYSAFSFDCADSLISYFAYKPKIWVNFVTKNITNEDLVCFFYENIHSQKLSQIIIEIKENTQLLTDHLQIEYIQLLAIENSEISYNQIKESFMSFLTQKDRHHFQQIISYLVENGEIWDLALSIIKSNRAYLIQTLKLEIMKSQSHDFESLPEFVKEVPIEYFDSFFNFFFDCYSKLIDIELFQSIVSNIEPRLIPLFERIFKKYSFNFEFDFQPFLPIETVSENQLNEWDEYANYLLIFDSHDDQEIRSILDKLDLDTPSYIFKEIENLVLNENYESVNTLMMRFIHHRNHFVSILKFVNANKGTFCDNAFEQFSNELALFISTNLLNTNDENVCENVHCFNALCSLIPPSEECSDLHLIWAKKLSEIANSILPVFVRDDHFFHSNYSEFNSNLILLVSLFGSQCAFVRTYFGIISKFYYENNSIILHELFESIPEMVSHLDKVSEIDFNPFISLLTQIVNENKHLAFSYALYALKEFNQKGFVSNKKVPGLFSLIIKNELTDIPLSKINFSFDSPLMNSLKNVFCRWYLKDMNTENFATVMDKIGQKNDLSNWFLFSRSQITDDFDSIFQDENQYNHFFSTMPFEIIQRYSKYIIDESSIPIYYYKRLTHNRKETKKTEKNPVKQFTNKLKEEKGKFKSFFKQFSIEYYYNHIITNTDSQIISFKSDPDSVDALNYLNASQISFYSGVDACIYQPDLNFVINRKPNPSFQLLQDAMTIIGIPKCYPNQIIERLSRAKDAAFVSLKSSEIVQFLCLCSLCQNPIVPPYFSRYHSIELFENFNRILNFATTKGIDVDFSPLEKSEPFISQSQCNLNGIEKVQILKTKENFLIYALKNQFDNPHIWADLSAIENDDMLYLFLHSNLLPLNAKKEVLKQIKEFPFRWGQILFDDIKRGIVHESFISLVSDVFRIDYSSIFSPILNLNEIQKLRTKSLFESKIMDEEHPSHNFTFIVNPIKKFFPVLPIHPPLLPTDPLSSFNFPMHSIFLSIEKENSSSSSIEICLSDGSKVNYLLTAMVNKFSPELFVVSHLLNKIMRKRVYCRSKHLELISPLFQSITKDEKDCDLFIVRTNAKQLVQYSIYEDLLKVKREGKYPPLKNFNQFRNFKASKDFFAWETAFLHRFAAMSHFQVGLNLKVFLPFHLLVDERDASIQFIQIRKTFSEPSFLEKSKETVNGQKVRIYGELIKFISPQCVFDVLPTAMVNIAMSFKFYNEKVSVILDNLIGISYSEKMERFNQSLLNKDGLKVVENLISSSCCDVPITDIPWF